MSKEPKKSFHDKIKDFFIPATDFLKTDTGKSIAIGGTLTFLALGINYFLQKRLRKNG